MTNWNILLEKATNGQTTATVVELPACQVTAITRQLALEQIEQLLTQRLSEAEVVSLAIPSSQKANPWIEFGGVFKDDADFADIVEDLQAERTERL